ncbi:MAG: NirD/YgiW/YdeI family stress tolerance protein [Burkholderiaceae bacterium]|nr:NirD/YgiW/YdeI family stress tolerance protein [Burkholderiaceae bacterium]MCD8517546.1 NirD/YgiW/YdeI family stress tolerance protein [Burkholderiaceae bacterium]MCD8537928.1 NirD/YgiW/YdeI family stress tolerance protein [Burkholderiaceae bacterium]MCD8565877.1 NirD/YgiW/YdeI family stress tolerance protein [Burkholderiaceae bacterium]
MRKTLPAFVVAAILLPGVSFASNENINQSTVQANITAIDDVKRGSMVTVRGTVERILDTDEFRLADDTGDIKVYIGWQNFVPVDVGESVTVKGFVDNDLILELYAREIVHSDGRITRFKHNS